MEDLDDFSYLNSPEDQAWTYTVSEEIFPYEQNGSVFILVPELPSWLSFNPSTKNIFRYTTTRF